MFSKYVFGPLLILVRLMPVLLTMPARGDLCPNYPIGEDRDQIVKHINYTNGREHCCKQVMCTAGHEVRYCSLNNPNDTACVPCRMGFYNADSQLSFMNPRCIAWKNCSAKSGLVSNNDGTAIFRGTCRCDVSRGFYNNKWGNCKQKAEKCEPDHEINIENGECQACRAGTEQLLHGFGPCTECPINTQKLNGHTNCSKCPAGTYKPKPGYGKCQTCAELIENGIKDAKCIDVGIKLTPTPKIGATTDNDNEGDSTVVIAVGVSVSALLILLLVLAGVYVHRRRKQQLEKRRSPRPSPVKAHAAGPYRAVSENSTSSDNSSHSSAEDAIEAEKVKAQNKANLTANIINEKSGLPPTDINTDYASPPPHGQGHPNGYPQGYPQGQPNGYPPGQPNGFPGGYPPQVPPEQGGFLIVNPSNCNISLGQQNQLHMTPNNQPGPQPAVHAPPPARAPPPEGKIINNLNVPRSRQSAPPTLATNQQSAAPADFSRSPDGQQPYYEDEADRLEAYYNSGHPSEC